MLGGLGQLARPDAVTSLRFLSEFVNPPSASTASSILSSSASTPHNQSSNGTSESGSTAPATANKATSARKKLPLPGTGPSHVLDCGAGIGRVTKQVLIKAFDHVDLVENCATFVKQAKEEYLKAEIASGRVGEVRCCGLQNVHFEGTSWEGRFDVIWCQWVLGHLTEEDLIAFFKRCQKGLKPGGLLIIKENNAKTGIVIDEDDSSMTRSDLVWKDMFQKAGLRLLREEMQKGFPSGLFAVKITDFPPLTREYIMEQQQQQPTQNIKIGWIGLGEMGIGMAINLQKYLASQSAQLIVWNRTPSKADSVQALGAHVATSVEELVSKSNVVFTSLSNDAAVDSIYSQLISLASQTQKPMIFIETSTIHPSQATKNAQQLSSYSQHKYLQCPVFGRPPAAHAAQLIWVASGDAEAIQKLRPYFSSMSKAIIDLKSTDVATASSFKLIGNFFVMGTIELLAEGLNLAEKVGIDQQAVLQFIHTFFPGPSWTGYSQKMADRSTSKEGGFPVDLGLKDVGHIRDLAAQNGASLPTADLAYKHLKTLQDQGKGEQDWSSIINVLREMPASQSHQ
ncbi:hypothetical protein BGZ50_000740 [Haplosporangium sp. Z 11]|nr:hypothetical protein BGZ50_000740 [Haplosporangium sp. Z 11]